MPITTPLTDMPAARDDSAAWLRPELIQSLAPSSERVVAVPAGVITEIMIRNPRRIGFAAFLSVTVTDGTFLSPFSRPDVFGVPIPAATRVVAFAVDDLYALIGNAWYAYHASGATILVSEFVKPA